jgi:hypothetical protein
MSDPEHLFVWHTGAIVIMAVLGWLAGWIWSRLRWRGMGG